MRVTHVIYICNTCIRILYCSPEGLNLDVKKSSYKKVHNIHLLLLKVDFCLWTQLSRFLGDMQLRGIMEVKELTQGVDSIVSFDRTHPE